MHKSMFLAGVAAAGLAACGQSGEQTTAKAPAAKKKPAYCFFKDAETKSWTASRGKDGSIIVKGKAYREDSRYKAVFGPAIVSGVRAELSPTVTVNDTGFGAPDNWWDVSATIPNSAAIHDVAVTCGSKTLAELNVSPRS
jgi:hypothetical protein